MRNTSQNLPKLVAENFQKSAQVAYLWGFLLIVLMISILSPPLQSPDEPAHLLRAYALSHGHIVYDVGPHGKSGAEVDVNLNQYFGVAKVQAQMCWAALGMNLLKAHRKLKSMEMAGAGAP